MLGEFVDWIEHGKNNDAKFVLGICLFVAILGAVLTGSMVAIENTVSANKVARLEKEAEASRLRIEVLRMERDAK